MGDEQRNFGNRNRNRYPRGGGRSGHQGGRGRHQRPLLTSAINAAGLSLVALVVVAMAAETGPAMVQSWLATAAIVYSLSAIVSYIAQRVSIKFVEKISDVFFLAGTIILIVVAWQLGGFVVA